MTEVKPHPSVAALSIHKYTHVQLLAFLAGALAAAVLFAVLPHPYEGIFDAANRRPSTVRPLPPHVARYQRYGPVMPIDALERGVVYAGTRHRLERFASKLVNGQPVKVATIGGSITANSGASKPGRGYPGRFFYWLNSTFPHPQHELHNKGIGGTHSGIYALCVEKMVPADIDIAIIEFSFNEGGGIPYDSSSRKGFEMLLRKLLLLPSRPVVILLHHYAWWHAQKPGTSEGGLYWFGAETDFTLYAQYYGLPSVSMRAAAYHLFRKGVGSFKVDKVVKPVPGLTPLEPGDRKTSFFYDCIHPSDIGHQALADLLIHPVWQAVLAVSEGVASEDSTTAASSRRMGGWGGLHVQSMAASSCRGGQGPANSSSSGPGGEAGGAVQCGEEEDEVPPSMAGGPDAPTSTCFLQEEFKGVVTQASNFSYVPARPEAQGFTAQKWAWTGTAPGAWVELHVDSREDRSSIPQDGRTTTIILGHLKSYESMGSAKVECVSGCTCPETVFEGTWDTRATLMQMHEFQATQHAECRLRVTILPETKSGQHKISLAFLMVATYPIALSATPFQVGQLAEMN